MVIVRRHLLHLRFRPFHFSQPCDHLHVQHTARIYLGRPLESCTDPSRSVPPAAAGRPSRRLTRSTTRERVQWIQAKGTRVVQIGGNGCAGPVPSRRLQRLSALCPNSKTPLQTPSLKTHSGLARPFRPAPAVRTVLYQVLHAHCGHLTQTRPSVFGNPVWYNTA